MGSQPSKLSPSGSGDNVATTGSDEYGTRIQRKQHEFVCTTCARNGKNRDASNLCNACRDFLCYKCLQWHFKYRADHVDDIVGQDEMRNLGVQWPPLMVTEKCLAHDGKPWNMFCLKDSVAGCQLCMIQDHRSCESVIPRSSLQIETASKQLKKMSLLGENADNTNTPRNDRLVFPKIQSDGEVGGKMREISDGLSDLKKSKTPGESDDGQVGGRKVKHSDELQVSGKNQNDGRNENNDQIAALKKDNKDTSQTAHSLTDIGHVPGLRNQHPGLCTVGMKRDVNIKVQSDQEECEIYDMCVLPDGRILMSDFKNHKLKLLDSNLNMTHHCEFPYCPRGVCMINDTEAAVTMYKLIQFVCIGDKIEIGRSIQLSYDCCGLVYSGGELYLSDGFTNIHVYTVEGQKLRRINSGLNDHHTIFGYEWLTVSNDGSKIYMTNWNYGIVCLDRVSEEVIWKFNDTDDSAYSGACVDRDNNVFVCRWGKGDVEKFSPDGQLTKVVINASEGLLFPRSICSDKVRDILIVGRWANMINVFDLNCEY